MHQPQGSQQLDGSALNFGKVSKGTCHLMSQRNLSPAKQVTKQQITKQTSGVQAPQCSAQSYADALVGLKGNQLEF